MANENAVRDANDVPSLLAVDDVTGETRQVTTDSDGNILVTGIFETALADLTDVSLTNPQNGDVLTYNGSVWVNQAGGGGGGANTALSNLASVAINTSLLPGTNDGAALGSATLSFSDLFLATGGVINIANGNWVATHTSGILTVGTGDLRVTTAGTNAASVVTVQGSQSLTSKTYNGLTVTTTTGTLTIANGKTVTINNSITFAGTDSTTMTFPATTATIARTDAAQTFTGVQTFTSPATTTSITTGSTSFTAWAGATTLLTIGGTGASASMFMPSTLDTTSSTTGAIRTSGGISAAKAMNVGTAITVGTTIELGNASDTTLSRSSAGVLAVEGVVVPTISSTNTLTNKRVTLRVGSTASSATPTIDTDAVDSYDITALATNITSMTTNLTGTPTTDQRLWLSFTDNGTARTITWGSSFEASGTTALPTTTVINTRLDVGFIWNSATSKWRCVATS